ncbi:MAG: PucR family transcriptional regulator [Actinomycetota bacterium]
MALTLAEFLELPSVREARPLLIEEPQDLSIPVRWVHSSEIYEIGPLLSEGDLLLTTGLGLAGADAGARRHWVRELAGRGVAAVGIELGRSLDVLPAELLDEARRRQLPLVVLQDVVPFIRICEEANSAILDADRLRLRLVDALVGEVHAALAAGGGTSALVESASRLLETPAALVTRSRQVVAASGVTGQRQTERLVRRPVVEASVRLWDIEWGSVVLGESSTDVRVLELAAPRLAGAAAVLLGRAGAGGPSDVVASFLGDLLSGAVMGHRELIVRAGLAGFHPPRGALVVGVAATSSEPEEVVNRIRAAASEAGMDVVAHRVRGEVLGLVAVPQSGFRSDAAGSVGQLLGADRAVITVGPAVQLPDAGRSLREAHSALGMADLLGETVALTRDLALASTLGQLDRERLERLADDALAPLLAWDRSHGSDLVRTLTVHLRHGCRPSRTAEVLHIQRQSLYQRLGRIEQLLGRPVDDPSGYEYLIVATCAHRVLDAQRRQERSHR